MQGQGKRQNTDRPETGAEDVYDGSRRKEEEEEEEGRMRGMSMSVCVGLCSG